MRNTMLSEGSLVSFDDAWDLVLKVGLSAHKYGSSATRLESFLTSLVKELGYQGEFRSTPLELTFSMRATPASQRRVKVIATQAPGIDLDKLARLGDVLNEIKAGTLSVRAAEQQIDAIDGMSPPWGKFASMLGYLFVGFGLAPLLGAGWMDTLLASIFSILVYGLTLLSARIGEWAMNWMPLTTALITGFLAMMIKQWVPSLNLVVVVLSAIAIILPGYSISLGAGKLVSKRVKSGIYNLKSGLVTLSKQIAGAVIGVGVAGVFVSASIGVEQPQRPVDPMWTIFYFPVLLVGLSFAFQVSRRDLPWSVMVCALAYLGVEAGSNIINPNVGNLLGTIVAVVVANYWARRTGRPTSIVLIPAIVMLVSGSIGFRGLATIVSGDVTLGVHQFLQMFIVAFTIMIGVVIGFIIVRPKPNL